MRSKKLSIIFSVCLLFASVIALTPSSNAELHNPTVFDDTTSYHLYGVNPNVTITIDSIETELNNTVISYTLRILSPAIGDRGEPINSSDYYTSNTPVLRYHLYSGAAIDFDCNTTLNAIWVDWLVGTNVQIENDNEALNAHSYSNPLNFSDNAYYGTVVASNLADGVHNVTVWVRAGQNYLSFNVPWWAAFSKTETFIVDTTAPQVTVQSPTNHSYGRNIPLAFDVNEGYSQAAYSLDNAANVTIDGDTTLEDLPDGLHNVTVYAWDNAGNVGVSQTVRFTVEAFDLLLWVMISVVLVAVVLVGLSAVYFHKKRRRHN